MEIGYASFASAAETLEKLADLPEGWNGYSATAPSHSAIRGADWFMSVCKDEGLFPTRIAPSAVGGVGTMFRAGPRKGYVEFYNDGSVALLLADDGTEQLQTRAVASNDQDFRATI